MSVEEGRDGVDRVFFFVAREVFEVVEELGDGSVKVS